MFHHNPLIGETFATWYTQYSDIYEDGMADLRQATRFAMLLRKVNRSNGRLYSSYLQPMDPTEPTYEERISKLGSVVGDNSSLFSFTMLKDENVHRYVGIVD